MDRELALYRELNEKYNVSTSIISFGDKTEKQITKNYSFIKTYYNELNLHPRLYIILFQFYFIKYLEKLQLIKTNQFYGTHLAKEWLNYIRKTYNKTRI